MAQAGSATELHDLLRHGTAWDDALAHLAAHPHLAGVKDGLKRLPLHVALWGGGRRPWPFESFWGPKSSTKVKFAIDLNESLKAKQDRAPGDDR